ncbi:MAG: flagellar basal body P-ring protein FlgI [Opitutales bacterium]
MFKRLQILILAGAPIVAQGAVPAPTVPGVPGNPAAKLQTMSTLRPGMVGGGVRIKDLTFIAGARPNQLTGFGVVVGLNNTGDKDTAYSKQSLANMFRQFGVKVPSTSVSSKNSAAVMVTANLEPFLKSGSRIDVTVAAAGDATSLTGGQLISTPLLGPDGRVYAVAQGPVNNNAFALGTDAALVMKNHPTAGQVVNGAIVEKEVNVTLVRNNQIKIILRDADFTLAARMKAAINAQSQRLGGKGFIAEALDGNTILVNVPEQFRASPIDFIAHLHAIEVVPDSRAVVVMNEKTGTIVATARVRVLACAISHGNIFLQVTSEKEVIQPPPLAPAGATAVTVNRDTVKVTENGGGLNVFAEMPTVQEVARALNSLGATPRDMMAIFQELKTAKALQAELIVK